jgi:thioredoxin reductase
MEAVELLVIGGGPAGRAAATAAAQRGVQTMLVDEAPVPAGWMARQVPRWYGERVPADQPAGNDTLPDLDGSARLGVDVRVRHACWGVFDGGVAGLFDGERTWLVRARQLILATGSADIPLAFPGWTLPGVLGATAALDLLATRGSLGGRRSERVVILGSGALALEVARSARSAGQQIVAIVEIGPQPTGDPDTLDALGDDGVDVIPGHSVVYARGDGQVEQVMLGGVAADGTRAAGQSFPVRADALVVAIGRAPAVELPFLLGCAFRFDSAAGGYVPSHSATMETSAPGVYVAGDVAGATDARFARPELAGAEGEVAALSAALALGKATDADLSTALDRLARLRAELPAANQPVSPPAGAHLTSWHRTAALLAPGDLPVCRCEGITRDMLVDATVVVGADVPDEIKRVTRAGMGECQGRCCRVTVAGLLAERAGTTIASVPIASWRPPVRPVPMAALATEEVDDVPLHPAFVRVAAQLEADVAAGIIPAARAASARYKIDEENRRALADRLDEAQITEYARLLGITLRNVAVH